MSEQLNTQELANSLKQFVENYSTSATSKSKKIIDELAPTIKDASKKGIAKKRIFEFLKSKGLKMSYSTFSKWLDKLNIYSYKPRKSKKDKKVSEQNVTQDT